MKCEYCGKNLNYLNASGPQFCGYSCFNLYIVQSRVFDKDETITVDNAVDTFTLKIRSLHGVSEETLKNLIQTKYEVTEIVKTNCNVTYR